MIAPCLLEHVLEGEILFVASGVLRMLCRCHLLVVRCEHSSVWL